MSAFYRKYRPQTLADLIGQPQVQNSLQKAFAEKKLSHAYLFCGPRGTGKTSTARILAKMVNCTGKNPPCNICEFCISLTDGSNLDLIEIDAASNRGIDDVRALRENIKLSPSSAGKKVYIIDEVHMLTTEAFNALLKTLEEPPSHVLFILATTEVHKIPETILSRVTRLNFTLATLADLEKALQVVINQEKIQIDPPARHLIAKAAQGSFRDGLKILDQLNLGNEKITVETVEQSIQSGDFEQIIKLLNAIASKDPHLGLKLFLQSLGTINLKEYLLATLDLLRLMLFLKHNLVQLVEDDLGSSKTPVLTQTAQRFSLQQLIFVINCFQLSYERLRYALIPSLPIEVAIVEAAGGGQLKEKIDQVESSKSVEVKATPLVNTGRDDSLPIQRVALPVSEIKMVVVGGSQVQKSPQSDDMATIIDKWNYILETVKPLNFSLEALLRSVKILDCLESMVIIEVPYSFHQRVLETPKSRDLLESVLSDVLAKPVKIKTVIGKRPQRLEELQNVEIAADDEIIKIASEIFSSDAP